MTAKKTNINKKTVHIDQKLVKNGIKTSKTAKKDAKMAKLYSEDQICKIACMVFMLESQIARLCAASGSFLGDRISKYDFLKEYMAVDRTIRRLSKDFHNEIEKTIGKFRVFADDGKQVDEIKNGGAYASEND